MLKIWLELGKCGIIALKRIEVHVDAEWFQIWVALLDDRVFWPTFVFISPLRRLTGFGYAALHAADAVLVRLFVYLAERWIVDESK